MSGRKKPIRNFQKSNKQLGGQVKKGPSSIKEPGTPQKKNVTPFQPPSQIIGKPESPTSPVPRPPTDSAQIVQPPVAAPIKPKIPPVESLPGSDCEEEKQLLQSIIGNIDTSDGISAAMEIKTLLEGRPPCLSVPVPLTPTEACDTNICGNVVGGTDTTIDILDVIATVNSILGNDNPSYCLHNADMNGDGAITVLDVVNLVHCIMGTGGYTNPGPSPYKCGVCWDYDADDEGEGIFDEFGGGQADLVNIAGDSQDLYCTCIDGTTDCNPWPPETDDVDEWIEQYGATSCSECNFNQCGAIEHLGQTGACGNCELIIYNKNWFSSDLATNSFSNGEQLLVFEGEGEVEDFGAVTSPAVWRAGPMTTSYYNAYAAQDSRNLCPSGFRVPSIGDWQALIDITGVNALKHPVFGGTDDYGFSMIANGGLYNTPTEPWQVYGLADTARFWTSTVYDTLTGISLKFSNVSDAYTIDSDVSDANKKFGFPIRCVEGIPGEGLGEEEVIPWYKRTEDYHNLGWQPASQCIIDPDCEEYIDPVLLGRPDIDYERIKNKFTNWGFTSSTRDEMPGEYTQCPQHPSYFGGLGTEVDEYDTTMVGDFPRGCWRKTYSGDEFSTSGDIGCCDGVLGTGDPEDVYLFNLHDCTTLDNQYRYMCGGCSCPTTMNGIGKYGIAMNLTHLKPYHYYGTDGSGHISEGSSTGPPYWEPVHEGNMLAVGPACPDYMCVGGVHDGKYCDPSILGGVSEDQCAGGESGDFTNGTPPQCIDLRPGDGNPYAGGCSWGHKYDLGPSAADENFGGDWERAAGWNPYDRSCCPGCTTVDCAGPKDAILASEVSSYTSEAWSFADSPACTSVDFLGTCQTWGEGPGWDVSAPAATRYQYCIGICDNLLDHGPGQDTLENHICRGPVPGYCNGMTEGQCGTWSPLDGVDNPLDVDGSHCYYPSDVTDDWIANVTIGGCCGWSEMWGECVYKGCTVYLECVSNCQDYVSEDGCVDNCQSDPSLCRSDTDGDGICDDEDVGPGDGSSECIGNASATDVEFAACQSNCFDCRYEEQGAVASCCGGTTGNPCLYIDECGICGGGNATDLGCGCGMDPPEPHWQDVDGDGYGDPSTETNYCTEPYGNCGNETNCSNGPGVAPAGWIPAQGLSSDPYPGGDADPDDACFSNVFDAFTGLCCESGELDVCGECDGSAPGTQLYICGNLVGNCPPDSFVGGCYSAINPTCGGPYYDQCGNVIADCGVAACDDPQYPDCVTGQCVCGDAANTDTGCPCGQIRDNCGQCGGDVFDDLWDCAAATLAIYGHEIQQAECGGQLSDQCGTPLQGCGTGTCDTDPYYPNCDTDLGLCVCEAGSEGCDAGSSTGCGTCLCGEWLDLCGICHPDGSGIQEEVNCATLGNPDCGVYSDQCGNMLCGCGSVDIDCNPISPCAANPFYPNCTDSGEEISGQTINHCACNAGATGCEAGATSGCTCHCGKWEDCAGACSCTEDDPTSNTCAAQEDLCGVCGGNNADMDCNGGGGVNPEACFGTSIQCHCCDDPDGDGLGSAGQCGTQCTDFGQTGGTDWDVNDCAIACLSTIGEGGYPMVSNDLDPVGSENCPNFEADGVTPTNLEGSYDCCDDCNGTAEYNFDDWTGIQCACVGQCTGDDENYCKDCAGNCCTDECVCSPDNGFAFIDNCDNCVGGYDEACTEDCTGNYCVEGDAGCLHGTGSSLYDYDGRDECGECEGGNYSAYCTDYTKFGLDEYNNECSLMNCGGYCQGAVPFVNYYVDDCLSCVTQPNAACVVGCDGEYANDGSHAQTDPYCGECCLNNGNIWDDGDTGVACGTTCCWNNCDDDTSNPDCDSSNGSCYCDGEQDCFGICNGGAVLDACNICGGDGLSCCGQDGTAGCDNVCEVCDGNGNCECPDAMVDCAGECCGPHGLDNCGECDTTTTNDCGVSCPSSSVDCTTSGGTWLSGECWGGTWSTINCCNGSFCVPDNTTCDSLGTDYIEDECGECGGSGIPAGDCDCFGNVDEGCGCGVANPEGCTGDGIDDECLGYVEDACGVCNGSGQNYYSTYTYPTGSTQLCNCGTTSTVNGQGCCGTDVRGCDNICNSGAVDTWCDGVCDSGKVDDECDVCDGPGAIYECGCSDIASGKCDCDGNVLDECGVCGGNGSSCDCTNAANDLGKAYDGGDWGVAGEGCWDCTCDLTTHTFDDEGGMGCSDWLGCCTYDANCSSDCTSFCNDYDTSATGGGDLTDCTCTHTCSGNYSPKSGVTGTDCFFWNCECECSAPSCTTGNACYAYSDGSELCAS